jgi:hypothetical protein
MDKDNSSVDTIGLVTLSKQVRDEIYLMRFWEKQYVQCHIRLHHYKEVHQLRIDFINFFYRISGFDAWAIPPNMIEEYGYNLIKAWHLMRTNHGLPSGDLLVDVIEYVPIINELDNEDSSLIERIHGLSYKFGFPVLDFDLSAECLSNQLIRKLQTTNPEELFELEEHPRLFYKEGPMAPGIHKIYTTDGPAAFRGEWDLAIYASIHDKPYHISNELKRVWELPSRQVIGDIQKSHIAFYIDRNTSRSRSWVNNLVTLEIQDFANFLLKNYQPLPEEYEGRDSTKNKRNMFYMKSIVEHSRVSQGLTHKRWDRNKANVRRTVGLYLWDNLNNNAKQKTIGSFITDLIEIYLPPELLEFYHEGYNSQDENNAYTSGLASTRSTVIAEMYHDLELTEKCISDYTYYLPSQIKKRNKG